MFYFKTKKTANPTTREARDARVPRPRLSILGALLQVLVSLEICLAFRMPTLVLRRLQMASFCWGESLFRVVCFQLECKWSTIGDGWSITN